MRVAAALGQRERLGEDLAQHLGHGTAARQLDRFVQVADRRVQAADVPLRSRQLPVHLRATLQRHRVLTHGLLFGGQACLPHRQRLRGPAGPHERICPPQSRPGVCVRLARDRGAQVLRRLGVVPAPRRELGRLQQRRHEAAGGDERPSPAQMARHRLGRHPPRRGQRVGQPQVQALAHHGRQPVAGRLGQERVGQRVGDVAVVHLLARHAGGGQARKPLEHLGLGALRRLDQLGVREGSRMHREQVDQRAILGRETCELLVEGRAQRRWQLRDAARPRGGPLAVQDHEGVPGGQRPRQRHHEQRQAAAALVDDVDEPRAGRRTREQLREQHRGLLACQRPEDDLVEQTQPSRRREERGVRGWILDRPRGTHEQEAIPLQPAQQVVQQLQRRGVRPVQVVDDQQQRGRGRDALAEAGERVDQAHPLDRGVAERLRAAGDPREEPPELRQPERRRRRPACAQPPEVGPERLDHRVVGERLLGLVPAPAGHQPPGGTGLLGEGGQQGALADAGLAGHQHRLPCPRGRALQRGAEPRALGLPPYEGRELRLAHHSTPPMKSAQPAKPRTSSRPGSLPGRSGSRAAKRPVRVM